MKQKIETDFVQAKSKISDKSNRLYSQSEIDDFLITDQICKEDSIFFKWRAATGIAEEK